MEEDDPDAVRDAPFAPRALHAALTHAAYAAVAPLLPALGVHSTLRGALALWLFTAAALLPAVAPLLVATLAPVAPLMLAVGAPIELALFLCGAVAVAQQRALVARAVRREALAMRLAVLHSTIAAAAVLAPVIAAALVEWPWVLFGALALVQTAMLPTTVRSARKEMRANARRSTSNASPPQFPSLKRHPRLVLVLLTMFASAATSSFLRPLLALHLVDARVTSSYMQPALLFSLHAVAAFLAETLVPPMLSHHIGLRTAVILGVLTSLAGFAFVYHTFLIAGVFFVALGSSTSLVLAVSDLAATTNQTLTSVSDPIAVLASRTFSLGEGFGILLAGALAQQFSFSFAVMLWYRVLIAVAVVAIVPHFLAAFISCCKPFSFLVATSMSSAAVDESTPLLPASTSAQQRAVTFDTNFSHV